MNSLERLAGMTTGLDDPPHVVIEKMARRLEHYERTGEMPLADAPKRCASCPFRGMGRSEQADCALVPAQDWPCHTTDDEHCAGHAAAMKRFGPPTLTRI